MIKRARTRSSRSGTFAVSGQSILFILLQHCKSPDDWITLERIVSEHIIDPEIIVTNGDDSAADSTLDEIVEPSTQIAQPYGGAPSALLRSATSLRHVLAPLSKKRSAFSLRNPARGGQLRDETSKTLEILDFVVFIAQIASERASPSVDQPVVEMMQKLTRSGLLIHPAARKTTYHSCQSEMLTNSLCCSKPGVMSFPNPL